MFPDWKHAGLFPWEKKRFLRPGNARLQKWRACEQHPTLTPGCDNNIVWPGNYETPFNPDTYECILLFCKGPGIWSRILENLASNLFILNGLKIFCIKNSEKACTRVV